MSGVFQKYKNIDWVERGVGVNILEDARHSSVLYICKYFVATIMPPSATRLRKVSPAAHGQETTRPPGTEPEFVNV
jgi:hypothetical protein